MRQIEFANPQLLWLLLILVPIIIWYIYKQRNAQASIQISDSRVFTKIKGTYKSQLRHLPFIFRLLALVLIIIVIARPQSSSEWESSSVQGIDIMLALDISSSMLAQDFRPNRIEAAKAVATEFISGRRDDRIGLVVFSGESFTQCPLTTDHAVLINLLKDMQSGIIEDGTAIGLGLANAVKRLKDSDAISKVVILLTDGVNNRGSVDPSTAAELAKTFGVRVYTIGVGSRGQANSPYAINPFTNKMMFRMMPVEIDEETLQNIADVTGGRYFRATNNEKLREIYSEIDQLERSKIDVKEFSRKQEEYLGYALVALILIFLDFLFRNTLLRTIP